MQLLKLDSMIDELGALNLQYADLMKAKSRALKMQKVWPEVFAADGKAEAFTTRLGGIGEVPLTYRYFLRRLSDGVTKELTYAEWAFIYPNG